jgi:hypothetical protein
MKALLPVAGTAFAGFYLGHYSVEFSGTVLAWTVATPTTFRLGG